jgi:transcriptional regulator with XRE-family HTH domain
MLWRGIVVDGDEMLVGRRVREVRLWRGLSVAAVAGLAGISAPYLSMIERGQRPVTKRALLEGLARALRVSPVELTGKPYAPTDVTSNESHAAMAAVEDALVSWWVGEVPDVPARPWAEVQADVDRLMFTLFPAAGLAEQGALLPGLIRDLLAAAGRAESGRRRDALIGLMNVYYAAQSVAVDLGFHGPSAVAIERMRQVAEELDDPVWHGLVGWVRAQAVGCINRTRQYELAVQTADAASGLRPEIGGMANLTAALSAAARGDEDTAQMHLAEAAAIARPMEADASPWMQLQFGRTNVGIWSVAIGVELGHGARVAEVAAGVRPQTITPARQAYFWADYGRGLVAERTTRERGIAALLRAEQLAPQQTRNNVYVREAVADLLTSARRDAGGRELRGLAWRMGIAPIG